MRHIEDQHQQALFSWAKCNRVALPGGEFVRLSDVMIAIPNGGKRNKLEAARLKAGGVKAGVSDIYLVLPVNGFSGLWIELKKPKVKGKDAPKVQKSQKEWLTLVNKIGHIGVVCYGMDEAKAAIVSYLGDRLEDRRALVRRV